MSRLCREEFEDRGVFVPEVLQIDLLIIGGSILPATEDNSDPLERQCAKDGMVSVPRFLAHGVEGPGPEGLKPGMIGQLVEGLT